jgi:hypothetical protein
MGVGVSLAACGGGRGGAGARVFRRLEDIVFGAELRNEQCEGGQLYFFKKTRPPVIAGHLAGPFVQVLLYTDTVFYFI